MIAALGVIIIGMVIVKMKPVTGHLKLQTDKNPFLHLWHTIAKRNYRIGFMATAFLSIGGFMLMPFGSAFLVNNVHISYNQLPITFLCTGLASIIIMPVVGKLSDRIDKFKIFAVGSFISFVMILIYTNIGTTPLWEVIAINCVMFMGIMGRMIPASALNTAIPDMRDRGAFMSINASLQQMAGGIAAVVAGMIVTQQGKTAPLEHYNILGYVVAAVILICMFFVYRVSVLVKKKFASAASKQNASADTRFA
jgi:predicted MFS family arabinose efflux permease